MYRCGSEIETKSEDRKISLILNNCCIAEWKNLLKTVSNMLQSVAPRTVDPFTDRNPECKLPPYGKCNSFFLFFLGMWESAVYTEIHAASQCT